MQTLQGYNCPLNLNVLLNIKINAVPWTCDRGVIVLWDYENSGWGNAACSRIKMLICLVKCGEPGSAGIPATTTLPHAHLPRVNTSVVNWIADVSPDPHAIAPAPGTTLQTLCWNYPQFSHLLNTDAAFLASGHKQAGADEERLLGFFFFSFFFLNHAHFSHQCQLTLSPGTSCTCLHTLPDADCSLSALLRPFCTSMSTVAIGRYAASPTSLTGIQRGYLIWTFRQEKQNCQQRRHQ